MATMVARARRSIAVRAAAGPLAAGTLVAGLAMILAVAIARYWLGLPAEHVKSLARFFLVSGGTSLLVTLGAAWLLLRMPGRLVVKLGVVCAIGPAVAAINTYYTADNMLIKQDDLGLLILVLLFSGSVGVAFALALARALTARIGLLARAAEGIARADRGVMAPEGPDEVGALGRVLNDLAGRLRESDARGRELEEARRLLLAAVSHDLRTPLTSLRVVVEALDEGVVEDRETARRYLASARGQLRQLETLIEDLFELSKMDAGALELHRAAVPVTDLIAPATEGLHAQAAEAEVILHAMVAPGLPPVFADSQRVARVLLNLLGNALRHTPAGGAIAVTAGPDGSFVRISVRDSGTGIAAADLPHVFERFYRGEKSRSRSHGGAGLGLAIAHGLVEAHGGRIWAESGPGEGATISFTLPIDPGTATAPPLRHCDSPAPSAQPVAPLPQLTNTQGVRSAPDQLRRRSSVAVSPVASRTLRAKCWELA